MGRPKELYNAAIAACEPAGEWLLASQLMSRMHRLGVARDADTYGTVVRTCAAGGDAARSKLLAAVDHLLREPPRRVAGWTEDLELCDAAFAACAASGHWRSASAMLAVLHPEVGRLQKAQQHVQQHVQQQARPQKAQQQVQSQQQANAPQQVQQAQQVRQAQQQRLWYARSLEACASQGEWRTAVRLLGDVTTRLQPTNAAAAAVGGGSGGSDAGAGAAAAVLVECYAHAIAACSNAGQWAALLQVYEQMQRSHLTPPRSSHNAAILALGKTGNTQRAMELFKAIDTEAGGAGATAAESGFAPDVGFAREVGFAPEGVSSSGVSSGGVGNGVGSGGDGFASRAAAAAAAEVMDPAPHQQVPSDRVVCGGLGGGGGSGSVGESAPLGTASFNAALIACVEGREYAAALELVEAMRARRVRMNALSYTAAIAAAQKVGDTEAAVAWLEEMGTRRELQQNELTLNAAVSAHSRTWRYQVLPVVANFPRLDLKVHRLCAWMAWHHVLI